MALTCPDGRLPCIAEYESLESLFLSDTKVTIAIAEAINSIDTLTHLALSNCELPAETVGLLSKLKVESIEIETESPEFDADMLLPLADNSGIEYLCVSSPTVSDLFVARFNRRSGREVAAYERIDPAVEQDPYMYDEVAALTLLQGEHNGDIVATLKEAAHLCVRR